MENSFNFDFIFLNDVDSTNLEAARYINENKKNAAYKVICANKQTAGKGREDRKWHSPEGNLYLTIIIPKTNSLEVMSQLSFVTSLAIHKSLKNIFKEYGLNKDIKLKWPNDVLVDDKKISGILIEAPSLCEEYILVGVGLNISSHPDLQDKPTTSLKNEGVDIISNINITNMFMNEFNRYYKKWLIDDFIPIRDEWIKNAQNIGKLISVNTRFSRVSGKFIDIDLSGSIRLKISSGQIFTINTGEVFFE